MTNPINHLINPQYSTALSADIVENHFMPFFLNNLGIKSDDVESKSAVNRGGALVLASLTLDLKNIHSRLPAALAALGVGIAITPAIKRYFSSFSQTNPSLKALPLEPPKTPNIPLVSLGKTPKKMNYDLSNASTHQDVSNSSSELQSLKRAINAVKYSLEHIGDTPLHKQIRQGTLQNDTINPENNPETIFSSEISDLEDQRRDLATKTVKEALEQISNYLNHMGPILKEKLHLSAITSSIDEKIKTITDTNTINKKTINELLKRVNRAIDTLQESIESLSSDVQTVVPALDYESLNLKDTQTLIREHSFDDRITALKSLNNLKDTYQTALTAILDLCHLKDSMDKLNEKPTSEHLATLAHALKKVSDSIEVLEKNTPPLLPIDWIKETTKDYTYLMIEYLESATKITTNQMNAWMNLGKDTHIPKERLQFLTKLKNTINTKNLIDDDVKDRFSKLENSLGALLASIEVKQSFQPIKNATLLALKSLAVTAIATGAKLASDVAVALWNKK